MLPDNAIAITGMSGRFPGARNLEEFWANLRDGVEAVRPLADAELAARGVEQELIDNPDYVKAASILEDLDQFDAPFFGMSPREAAIMDPQQRVLLECAWEALEDAGWSAEAFPGRIGAFAGSGLNAYLIYNLLPNRKLMDSAGMFLIKQTGNDKDVLTTRLSYQMNLTGPAVTVQTACSTSLVAVHMACQSLLTRECDLALAGGVSIDLPHGVGYLYRPGEILSRDGHCRAFDAASSGTVFGSGAGLVALRRLEDALAEGERIYAVIRGTAINNDGSRKAGYLAPSVAGQAEVIREALAVAGVPAASISYVETHGTGTQVGDPIEVAALNQAYEGAGSQGCRIGSVKSNIGHLDAAAGIAGLIKTVLALRHRQIPPSLHFEKPNPQIPFDAGPFRVNSSLTEWRRRSGEPLRAAVTALGIGGTNAHVILEEAPQDQRTSRKPDGPPHILALSAKTETALDALSAAWANHLSDHPELSLAGAAYASQVGRKAFERRRAIVCRTHEEAVRLLGEGRGAGVFNGSTAARGGVAFLFPGQGAQHPNMARGLYEQYPAFRAELEREAAILQPLMGRNLLELLFPPEAEVEAAEAALAQTAITQPALFAVEYALAQLWMSWGVRPEAAMGHSLGEYVCACVAGVMTLEDALTAVAARGRLMQSAPAGAMLAAPLTEAEMDARLTPGLSLAAINAERQCVVAGAIEPIAALEERLKTEGIAAQRLRTSHGFHSATMDGILEPFARVMEVVRLRPPQMAFISNVSGDWITADEATDPRYWVRHLRNAVRCSDGLEKLFQRCGAFIEVGPGRVLSSLALDHPSRGQCAVMASLPARRTNMDDAEAITRAAAQLWASGRTPNWRAFQAGDPPRRESIPTYPFERKRHWMDAPVEAARPAVAEPDTHVWYYRPAWKRAQRPAANAAPARWLLFAEDPAARELAARLGSAAVYTVSRGPRFARTGAHAYALRPQEPADYRQLLSALEGSGPIRIVHLWTASAQETFESLLFLAQALGARDERVAVELTVVTRGMARVRNEAAPNPEAAVALGPVRVIPKEFPNVRTRLIDLDAEEPEPWDHLAAELAAAPEDQLVALRGAERWREQQERFTPRAAQPLLREGAAYVITGGAGALGRALAEYLTTTQKARVALVGRSAWPAGAASLRDNANVITLTADVTDEPALRAALAEVRARFGKIHGVFHAAGVIDDSLAQLKSAEAARRVLAPKLVGAPALFRALADQPPEFLLLFSSVSAYTAPVGQVDYAAANSFLNAFAAAQAGGPMRICSVAWAKWRGLGMGSAPTAAPGEPLPGSESGTADEWVFRTRLTDSLWVLTDHRLRNNGGLFPGTGYFEIAARAMARRHGAGAVELRNLAFAAPLRAGAEAAFRFVRDGKRYRFSATAVEPGTAAPQSVRTAEATVRHLGSVKAPREDVSAWLARCPRELPLAPGGVNPNQARHIDFGPRWRCLTNVRLGEGEAICSLELAPEFVSDLEAWRFHPALLDAAAGAALHAIPGYSEAAALYIPVSYESATLYAPPPPRCHCLIRGRAQNHARNQTVTFDWQLADDQGRVYAEAEGFTMRRLEDAAALLPVAPRALELAPEDALAAISSILRNPLPAEIAVCPAGMQLEPAPPVPVRAASAVRATPAATGELESTLIAWWEELLGVSGIGMKDDFFELGGHSLLAVRLLTRVERELKRTVPLQSLYEARTVERLAALVRGPVENPLVAPLTPARPGARTLYCVHSLGGDVAAFRHLAAALGPDTPFSGIQKPAEPGDFTIESLASVYVKELLAADPKGPYALGGWSAGSTIAFEMARQLEAQGRAVDLLVAIDGGPYNTGANTPPWSPVYCLKLLANLPRWIEDDLLDGGARHLPRRVWNKAVSTVRRSYAGPRADVSSFLDISHYSENDIDFMNRLFAALRRYVPKPWRGNVVVYQARTEPLHHLFEIDHCWRAVAGNVTVVRAAGTHLSLIRPPHVNSLAADLRPRLAALAAVTEQPSPAALRRGAD